MKPKVSIVVPIYCVEKYLPQCIDSLLVQTLKEIEIILVDDGSLDRSGEIAESYARQDARIRVIHQGNAGLGPARNTGIQAATGEYIGFVDSDDWIGPEMYERLYETASREDVDIVVGGHCDVTNNVVTVVKQHPLAGMVVKDREKILQIRKNLYGHGLDDKTSESFPMSVWKSIYRKSMVEMKRLRFREILSEDTIFNLAAYRYAQSIAFVEHTDYFYRKEFQQSITNTFSAEKKSRYQELLAALLQLAREEKDDDCTMRVKRTAIDYCRLYVRLVDNSADAFQLKRNYIKEFAETQEIARCWAGYPLKRLPLLQYLFHWMIIHRCYGMALVMNRLRRTTGKGKPLKYANKV